MNNILKIVACLIPTFLALGAVEYEPLMLRAGRELSMSVIGATTNVMLKYHQPFFATTRSPLTLTNIIESTDTVTFGQQSSVDSVYYRRFRDQLSLNDRLDQQQGYDFRIVLIGPNERGGLDTIAFNQTGGVLVNGKMYSCDNQLFFAMARMLPLEYQNSMLMVGQE